MLTTEEIQELVAVVKATDDSATRESRQKGSEAISDLVGHIAECLGVIASNTTELRLWEEARHR